jgi:hypothetical protein
MNVDPLAEQAPNWTPYHYVHNNPMNLVDPTGMSAEETDKKSSWFSRAWSSVKSLFSSTPKAEVSVGSPEFQGYLEDEATPNQTTISDNLVSFVADFTGGSQAFQIHQEAMNLSAHSDGTTDWGGYAAYSLMMEKVTNPGNLEIGRNLFGRSFGNLKTSSGVVSNATSTLSKSEYLRIQNASTRINKPITVVGSRASGTAGAYSDWDYVIPGLNSRNWSTIKNSLPGAKSALDNTPRNIDIFKGSVDKSRPHITIKPK